MGAIGDARLIRGHSRRVADAVVIQDHYGCSGRIPAAVRVQVVGVVDQQGLERAIKERADLLSYLDHFLI